MVLASREHYRSRPHAPVTTPRRFATPPTQPYLRSCGQRWHEAADLPRPRDSAHRGLPLQVKGRVYLLTTGHARASLRAKPSIADALQRNELPSCEDCYRGREYREGMQSCAPDVARQCDRMLIQCSYRNTWIE